MIQKGREITRNNLKQIVSDIFSAEISAVEPELCEDKYLKLESGLLRIEQFSYDLDVINNIYLVGTIPEALPAAEMRAKPFDFLTFIFSSTVQGEASEVPKVLSSIAREVAQTKCLWQSSSYRSYPFFKVLDNLLITSPTRTNVMTLQVMLIDKQS